MNLKIVVFLAVVPLLLGNEGGCAAPQRQQGALKEQVQANLQHEHMLRTQPVPAFQWSLERHLAIEIYKARQRSVPTVSVVQSEYTGKVLWQCDSIGFPLPYATQLTNPLQVIAGRGSPESLASVSQPEPNGLYTPTSADGSWVPCVDDKGGISPVYEERKVTTFVRRVREVDGRLVIEGASSLSMQTKPAQ